MKRVREYAAQKELDRIQNSPLPLGEGLGVRAENNEFRRINTTIDLNISAYIPDEFFGSSMDKMNFYRELESVDNSEDLQTIIDEFKTINPEFPPEAQNLFNLLKLKFRAWSFGIKSIKKNGQNYQLDFISEEWKELEILRKFLDLDKEVRFTVVDTKRLRTPYKKYGSDLAFMQYLSDILNNKKTSKKFKLKK